MLSYQHVTVGFIIGNIVEELWIDTPINIYNLRIFGSPTYVHIYSEDQSKLHSNSKKCVFDGYTKVLKRFKLWGPIKNKMRIKKDIILMNI